MNMKRDKDTSSC